MVQATSGVFSEMQRYHLVNSHAVSSLAHAAADAAEETLVMEMLDQADTLTTAPSSALFAYNAGLMFFTRTQPPRLRDAIGLVERMYENGVAVDGVAYATLTHGCRTLAEMNAVRAWARNQPAPIHPSIPHDDEWMLLDRCVYDMWYVAF